MQERYAPHSQCFGCGPASRGGLHLRSFWSDERAKLVAHFDAAEVHQAFPGIVCGGILGSLLDCNSNWCAAHAIMRHRGAEHPGCTVTAWFKVSLRSPAPLDRTLRIVSWVRELKDPKVHVDAKAYALPAGVPLEDTDAIERDENVVSTCEGLFIAVKPGHPAHDAWALEHAQRHHQH